jgi:hypothetical protein
MEKYIRLYRAEFKSFLFFFLTAILITVLHLLLHSVRVLGMDTSIFYMDEKYTLAAFYCSVTAFLVGYLALTASFSFNSKAKKITNTLFGLFFIVLALDEYFEVHEYANTLFKAAFNQHGLVTTLSNASWIFPLLIIIIAIFIMIIAKIKFADKAVKTPLIIGALCFVFILIFELIGSATYGQHIYLYFVAIEEGFEMVSLSLFLLAILIEQPAHPKTSHQVVK